MRNLVVKKKKHLLIQLYFTLGKNDRGEIISPKFKFIFVRNKNYFIFHSILNRDTINILENVILSSFKKNVDPSLESFVNIQDYPLRPNTNLNKFNKDVIYSKALFEIINSSSILDLIHTEIENSSYSLHPALNTRIQYPNNENSSNKFSKYLGWHQDIYTMDKISKETPIYTLWIPLTSCKLESGGLDIFETGSMLNDSLSYNRDTYLTDLSEMQRLNGAVRNITCEPGDIVLFDKYVLHKSRPNISNKNRISIDIRIFKTGMESGRGNQASFELSAVPKDKIYLNWINKIYKNGN